MVCIKKCKNLDRITSTIPTLVRVDQILRKKWKTPTPLGYTGTKERIASGEAKKNSSKKSYLHVLR